MEITEYHPFRSEKAKTEYLAHYNMRSNEWPIDSESKIVDTSYGQTFIRISGSDDAPSLVLLPGGRTSSLMWLPNIEALSECHKTYAVDSIHDDGLSVYTRSITRAIDLVTWLDELFSALELEDKINLMGMSNGGWLTCQYALHFPNRLDRIVLLAPAATVLRLRIQLLIRGMLSTLIPFRYFTKSMLYWLLEDSVHRDQASRLVVDDMIDDMFIATRCFKLRPPIAPTVLEDRDLKSIKVPTLCLVAENEKIYSAHKAIRRLNEVAPNIRTELIPNAGHDLLLVQTELVNETVQEFLKQP